MEQRVSPAPAHHALAPDYEVRCEVSHMWPTMGHDSGLEPAAPPVAYLFAGRSRKKGSEALHFDGQYAELPGLGLSASADEALASFPIGDMRPFLPRQLERDLYEHTPEGSSVPMWPHLEAGSPPRHLSVAWLASRASCSREDASRLADALAVLDADEKVSREVCRWARARGVEATLRYLFPFCLGVAEVESSASPAGDEEEDPVIGFQQVPALESMSVKALRKELRARTGRSGSRLRRAELITALTKLDQAEAAPEEPAPECLAYHPLCESPAPDWIESQPVLFREMIEEVRQAPSLPELFELGRFAYQLPFNDAQASVFWSFYGVRKRRLLFRVRLSGFARALLARMAKTAPARLGSVGRLLHQMQHQEVKAPPLSRLEWLVVWDAYFERKKQAAA